jgi:class 3 adenylate cyclase
MPDPITRLTPNELQEMLQSKRLPLLLDVRRRAAFDRVPVRLPGGIPLLLDADPLRIPDAERSRPVVTYCLCRGEASSLRAAQWLVEAGYESVAVLAGGLPEWRRAGYETRPADLAAGEAQAWRDLPGPGERGGLDAHSALVPLLAEQTLLAGIELPVRREMAVLFVDMVDSTRMVMATSAERALSLIQIFMAAVTEIALHHCGDVHDFAGDGALLYFAGPGEAVPAAFALRQRLNQERENEPELPEARIAVASGPLLIGRIGGVHRQGLSFLGPCVNIAARSLGQAPPGGIVVTDDVYRETEGTDPDLASVFEPLALTQLPKGIETQMPALYLA